MVSLVICANSNIQAGAWENSEQLMVIPRKMTAIHRASRRLAIFVARAYDVSGNAPLEGVDDERLGCA